MCNHPYLLESYVTFWFLLKRVLFPLETQLVYNRRKCMYWYLVPVILNTSYIFKTQNIRLSQFVSPQTSVKMLQILNDDFFQYKKPLNLIFHRWKGYMFVLRFQIPMCERSKVFKLKNALKNQENNKGSMMAPCLVELNQCRYFTSGQDTALQWGHLNANTS